MRFWYSIFFLLSQINMLLGQHNLDLKISLMLPFNSEKLLQNNKSTEKQLSDVCREYYQGIIIALDSIGNTNYPLNLYLKVFDTKKDTSTIKKQLQNDYVPKSNIIIGPALKEGHILMQNFCNQNHIYRVSPFVTLTKTTINDSMFISYNPDLHSYADILMQNLKNSGFENINLILIKGANKNNDIVYKRFKEIEKNYNQIKLNYIDNYQLEKVKNAYKPYFKNIIFVINDDESTVNIMLNQIAESGDFTDVIVIGMRKWLEFKTIPFDYWQNLNVTLLTPFFADYTNIEVNWFVRKYFEKFNAHPSEFAFEGYRQFMYLVHSFLKTNGNFDELSNLGTIEIFGLKNKLERSKYNQSIINKQLNMIRLVDSELKLIDIY